MQGSSDRYKKLYMYLTLSCMLLLLVSCSKVEDGHALLNRIAVIDTGISSSVIDSDLIIAGENLIAPSDGTEDRYGHGTAIAAIIAGSEPAGVSGVCEGVPLVPVVWTTLDEDGNTVAGDAEMIAQAIRDAVDEYGCRIINISLGTPTPAQELEAAVKYAAAEGALIVASSGNRYFDDAECIYYPGGYAEVLCVGAADKDGRVSSFTQRNGTVDIYATGEDLRLVTPKGTKIRGEGTSYAAAYVSGAAARIWQEEPELTAEEVREALLQCTELTDGCPVLDMAKVESYCGTE